MNNQSKTRGIVKGELPPTSSLLRSCWGSKHSQRFKMTRFEYVSTKYLRVHEWTAKIALFAFICRYIFRYENIFLCLCISKKRQNIFHVLACNQFLPSTSSRQLTSYNVWLSHVKCYLGELVLGENWYLARTSSWLEVVACQYCNRETSIQISNIETPFFWNRKSCIVPSVTFSSK